MGNMQPQNGGGRFFALAMAICFLLFLSGCRNAFGPDSVPEDAVGTGILSLTIGRQDLLRAITPDNKDDFIKFRLDFAAACDFGNMDDYEIWYGGTSGTVELNAGTWNLTVTAFLDGGYEENPIEAATGRLLGIQILSGREVSGNVTLSPVAQGQGTFSWDIDFDMANVVSARMTITRIGVSPSVYMGTFYFTGETPDVERYDSLELDAGQYRVIFTLVNDRDDRAVLRTILHVYRGMVSRFIEEFTNDHFGLPLLDFVLGAWDGHEWDFDGSGISAATFSFLGVSGVYDENFAHVTSWFNALGSAPADLSGLRVLADAALIGVVSDDDEFLSVNFGNRASANSAILGRVRNGTSITLAWGGDDRVVVRIGDFEIVFDKAVPAGIVPGLTLAAQLEWLRDNAQSGNYYIVEVRGDEPLGPCLSWFDTWHGSWQDTTLPTGRNDLTIILVASEPSIVSLTSSGRMFTVGDGLTLWLRVRICPWLPETVSTRSSPWNHSMLSNCHGLSKVTVPPPAAILTVGPVISNGMSTAKLIEKPPSPGASGGIVRVSE